MAVRGSAEGGVEHILDLARPVLNGREPADHFVVLVVRQIVAGVENVAIALQHKPLGVSIVSVFTAYLCCEILNWVRENVSALTHSVLAGEISYAVLIVKLDLSPLYEMTESWQTGGYSIAARDFTGKTVLSTSAAHRCIFLRSHIPQP